MLNILAATVITTALTSPLPPSCAPRLQRAEYHATNHQFGGFEFTVRIVPAEAAPKPKIVTWVYTPPGVRLLDIYVREDFLCTATDNALDLTLLHEALHLADSSLPEAEVEAVVKRGAGDAAFYDYVQELRDYVLARMQAWRTRYGRTSSAAAMPRGERSRVEQ